MRLSEWRLKVTAVGENVLSRLRAGADKAAESFQKAQNKIKGTTHSIYSLNAHLRQLTAKRNSSFSIVEIAKFNREISITEQRIARIEGIGKGGLLGGFRRDVSSSISPLGALRSAVIGAFSVYAIAGFTHQLIAATTQAEQLKNQLDFVAGSKSGGDKGLKFLKDTTQKIGLDYQSSAKGYMLLAGATRGTELQGEKTQKIYTGISTAAAGMSLSAEQTEGAILALSQMLSKGKVSAEELNGQLGERIPGALGIAGRAMGMTTQKLMKMMQEGKILSTDFVPRFTEQLKYELGPAAEKFGTSMQAAMNRARNEFFFLKAELGNELRPIVIDLMKLSIEWMQILKQKLKYVKEHKDAFLALAKALGVAYVAYKGLQITASAINSWRLLTGNVQGTTSALRILSNLVTKNPWMLAVLTIGGGLASWLYDAYDGMRDIDAAKKSRNLTGEDQKNLQWGAAGLLKRELEAGKTELQAINSLKSDINKKLLANQNNLNREVAQGSPNMANVQMFNKNIAKLNYQYSILEGETSRKNLLGLAKQYKVQKSKTDTSIAESVATSAGEINGGGSNIRNITVNIDALMKEPIHIAVQQLREGTAEIETIIKNMVLKAVQGAELTMNSN